MQPLDIHDLPGHLIRRLQQIAVAVFVEQTEGFGVTPVQYAILVAVESRPGLDQRRLSQLVAFDRSTIGDVVERLERRGLLRRKAGQRDRRTKLLYPTDLGTTTVREMRPYVDRVQGEILAFLTPDERSTFMALLAKLVERNHRMELEPPTDSPELEPGAPTAQDGGAVRASEGASGPKRAKPRSPSRKRRASVQPPSP